MNILTLGSSSLSRQMLLQESRISYICVPHLADETIYDRTRPLEEVVDAIALHKMKHVVLSDGTEGAVCYVLTADTMGCNTKETIQGKPRDRDDAIAMIIAARDELRRCSTAFYLDKKKWQAGEWVTHDRIHSVVTSQYIFDVPDIWVDRYFESSNGLQASGAIAIEGYGMQFLKMISGSYSTIIGLPLYELRQALEKMGFFF